MAISESLEGGEVDSLPDINRFLKSMADRDYAFNIYSGIKFQSCKKFIDLHSNMWLRVFRISSSYEPSGV